MARKLAEDWPDPRSARVVRDQVLERMPRLTSTDRKQIIDRIGCRSACAVTAQVAFTHPDWGPCVLFTTVSEPQPETAPETAPETGAGTVTDAGPTADITVLDGDGTVRWQYRAGFWLELKLALPARDATGNIFLTYNPGRYNGVIVLHPTAGGFEDFDTLPAPGGYLARFYGADLVGPDADGRYAVDHYVNDCTPSCAEGTVRHFFHSWNGVTYLVP